MTESVQHMDRRDWLLLAAILLLAGLLRCFAPGWTEFKADEARLLTLAWDMVEGGGFPLRGISSSVGLPNFPASVWFYALPLALWRHVYAATLFTALVNTAAVGLCYWFVRRYWGREAAVTAALFFAVSPWAIIHSRKIWAQNLIPLFALGWGIGGALALIEGRRRWLILHLVCAAIAFQIHLAAVSLLAGTLVLFVVYFRRLDWRMVIAGGLAALLTAVPFLYYLFFQTEYSLSDLSGAGESLTGGWSWNALLHAIRLTTGWQMHALAGPGAFEAYLATVPDGSWVVLLWLALVAGGALLLARQSRISSAAPFLLIWMTVPILAFFWFPTTVELHYLLPLYPAWFAAAGVATAWLAQRWRQVVWPIILVSAGWQVWLWIGLFLFLQQNGTPGGFSSPLILQLEAVQAARELRQTHDLDEVLIAGRGEDPLLDEFAAIYDLHLRGIPHRFVDLTHSAVFPAAGGVVLTEPGSFPLAADLTRVASESRLILQRSNEGEIAVIALPPEAAPQPAVPFDPPYLLANFVNLLGYDPLTAEGVWRLTWQVGIPAPVDYHLFNHLLDGEGVRVAQADAAAFAASQWREGDVVISIFELDLPAFSPRPWLMRSGMYFYPSLENVPLLDVAANPYADAAEIPIEP